MRLQSSEAPRFPSHLKSIYFPRPCFIKSPMFRFKSPSLFQTEHILQLLSSLATISFIRALHELYIYTMCCSHSALPVSAMPSLTVPTVRKGQADQQQTGNDIVWGCTMEPLTETRRESHRPTASILVLSDGGTFPFLIKMKAFDCSRCLSSNTDTAKNDRELELIMRRRLDGD